MKLRQKPRAAGFTLVELLVVIAIIAVLAVLGFLSATKMLDRGKKVQTLAQLRDLNAGVNMFMLDYQRPPKPASKVADGWDTIYGDPPTPKYHNGFLVAVLLGDTKDFSYGPETFKVDDVNPQHQRYIQFPYKSDSKGGVGPDGNLYDPWGTEICAAINGGKAANKDAIVDFNNGQNDKRLYTWGLAEYKDKNGKVETMPGDQDFVFWTYGRDKVKGTAKSTAYIGSDDVINW